MSNRKGSDEAMADEKYTFEQARIRLEEIATEVRKKDTSLEKSLDLLEEGVRLANICTELVDHTDMSASVTAPASGAESESETVEEGVEGSAPASSSLSEDAETGGDHGEAEDGVTGDDAEGADDSDGFDEADDEVEEPADAGIGD